MSRQCPSKSESPAPPPCEACESHDRKCKSQCSIDRMTHHAEIAELRAERDEAHDFIRRWLAAPYFDEKRDWRVWAKGMRKRAEAALAPPKKEGL